MKIINQTRTSSMFFETFSLSVLIIKVLYLLCPVPQVDSFAVCSVTAMKCLLFLTQEGMDTVFHLYIQNCSYLTALEQCRLYCCVQLSKASRQLRGLLPFQGITSEDAVVMSPYTACHCLDTICGSCTVLNLPYPCTNPYLCCITSKTCFQYKHMFSFIKSHFRFILLKESLDDHLGRTQLW